MNVHIDIDADLLKEAMALGDHRTKKAAVSEALAEYVRNRKQTGITRLFGTVDFDPEYDYKAQRQRY